jgi:hypothetical protein
MFLSVFTLSLKIAVQLLAAAATLAYILRTLYISKFTNVNNYRTDKIASTIKTPVVSKEAFNKYGVSLYNFEIKKSLSNQRISKKTRFFNFICPNLQTFHNPFHLNLAKKTALALKF